MISTEQHMHAWHQTLIDHGASLDDTQSFIFPESAGYVSVDDSRSSCFYLSHLRCIEITGGDAHDFLQGQLSCDMNTISDTHSGIGSHNNLKGRMISSFRILKISEAYHLIIDQSIADECVAQLNKYAVFSDVQIKINPDMIFLGVQSTTIDKALHNKSSSNGAVSATSTAHSIRVSHSTARNMFALNVIHAQGKWTQLLASCTPTNNVVWKALDIHDGLSWITHATQDMFLPQSLNYHLIDGLSFTKGCYIGQEVIVRTQHRGKIKRILSRFVIDSASLTSPSAITPGHALHHGGKTIGVITSTAQIGKRHYVLAVVHIDYAEFTDGLCDEHDQEIHINSADTSTPFSISKSS
ncbi:MAG: hypothetical protein AAGF06_02055 [Pseudomonadota bacterium]